MTFKDSYTTADKQKTDIKEKDKVVISNEGYVICEVLEALIRNLERYR